MKHCNDFQIVGIDHDYGNIKTANTVTPTGITKLNATSTFTKNILYYYGRYCLIGEGAGVRRTPLQSRSTDRGDIRDR